MSSSPTVGAWAHLSDAELLARIDRLEWEVAQNEPYAWVKQIVLNSMAAELRHRVDAMLREPEPKP